jgi:selenium donor protein
VLRPLQGVFNAPDFPDLLVGLQEPDDAAVWRLPDGRALVVTTDFFTPVVDEPYDYGAIAAANALSDIYAMGAQPIFALNIVGFPSNRLPLRVLEEILRGAQAKAQEAGISILGGHTVDDNEPKYGMVVTGLIHPNKILRNSTGQPGDVLILTKPIGTGILATALKQGLLDQPTQAKIIDLMAKLNRDAAECMREVSVNACTDVTGFGLLGHLHEMTGASKVDAQIEISAVPILPEAHHFAGMDIIPGGSLNNLEFVAPHVRFGENISRIDQILLADAQTSGGLLISLPATEAGILLESLSKKGINASQIGHITGPGTGNISVH